MTVKFKNKVEALQAKSDLVAKQRAMLDKAKGENRDLTEDEVTEFENLDAQIQEVEASIKGFEAAEERERRVAARERDLDQPANKGYRAAIIVDPHKDGDKDDAGFANVGEFLDALRFGDPKGRLASIPTNKLGGFQLPEAFKSAVMPWFRNEWTMGTGEEGGFAVPAQQYQGAPLMIQPQAAIVRPRATVVPPGDPPDAELPIPAFRQGASGVFGGVEVYWTGEGAEPDETSGKLREVNLKPQEVTGVTVVSDKLLRNWQAASAFIEFLLRGAALNTEDMVFLGGDGVGKPIGVRNGKGTLAVHRTTANKIGFADVLNMLAAFLPNATNGVWVANQSALPQIAALKDEAGNSIFIKGDITRGIPDTLAGIPIRFTGKAPALGSKGDLTLVDFQYYLIKDGSGPFLAASEHVYFKKNKTVIKLFWNVDGKGWVDEPLTLEDGVTKVSPYVVLDVPAV